MNITITGNLGAGKTSVCKVLKEKGYEVISAGSIFRQIAEEKGVDVVELNRLAEADRSIDDMLDARSAKLGAEKDGAVFDSRMAWHFVPKSFKVFLLTDQKVSARRVMLDRTRSAEQYASPEEAMAALKKRADLEQERFRELYGVDYYDVSNYDFVIETSDATPEQIADEIIRNAGEYERHPFEETRVELNPSSLRQEQGDGAPFVVYAFDTPDAAERLGDKYMANFGGLQDREAEDLL